MADKESFRHVVKDMVRDYHAHEALYLSRRDYNEFTLREELLDQFFEALGWNVRNNPRQDPLRREVKFERPNDKRKKPDYVFLLERGRKMVPQFFVEAKSPPASLDLAATINQAKSYAWNSPDAPTPISVLTNFRYFKVYDGSLRPDPLHPERGRLRETLDCTEYESNVDFLWNFSREAVDAGSLKRLLPRGAKAQQYRVPVDEAFLSDVSDWRVVLAKDLYRRNQQVSEALLNEVVQRTLDRLVFIRMAEDRGILRDGGLLEIVKTWKEQRQDRPIQGHINELYEKVHLDLNGEIFEKHACEEEAYWFTPKVFAEIIENLYFPNCPYLFDVIGVEMLGSIYERFLGKKLRLAGKRVVPEDKPEVKKAGGVVYTPRPIVDYIVEIAVMDQIRGKTPAEMSRFKVIDPACGSGSFLVSAFSHLIGEHQHYYETHPGTAGRGTLFPDLIVDGDSNRLSIEKKAEILRNSIFGVDIDPQAVEVTMMSLYLKALEGEETIPENKALLPRMKQNIKRGNSLVSRADLPQATLDGEVLQPNLHPFDWNDRTWGFGSVLSNGKFDAVIGNPPYVRIQQLKKWSPKEVDYIQHRYPSAKVGNTDLYIPFLEKATDLVRREGTIGFIVSNRFFQAKYGSQIRKLIADGKMLRQVVDFGHLHVFKEHATYPCMLFLSLMPSSSIACAEFSEITDLQLQLESLRDNFTAKIAGVSSSVRSPLPPGDSEWGFSAPVESEQLFRRLRAKWPPLKEVARIFRGGQTSADNVFILEVVSPQRVRRIEGDRIKVRVERLPDEEKDHEPFWIETRFLKPLYKSGEMHRYAVDEAERVLIFPYSLDGGRPKLIDFPEIEAKASMTADYLKSRKNDLAGRKGAKKWWAFGYPKNLVEFEGPKIMTRDIAPSAWYCIDETGGVYFPGGAAGGYGIRALNALDSRYLLGLLNSRLLDELLRCKSMHMQNGWWSYEYRFIKNLPIRTIGEDELDAKKTQGEIIERVARLLTLHPAKEAMPPSAQRDALIQEIDIIEREVDERVEALYAVSSDERNHLYRAE